MRRPGGVSYYNKPLMFLCNVWNILKHFVKGTIPHRQREWKVTGKGRCSGLKMYIWTCSSSVVVNTLYFYTLFQLLKIEIVNKEMLLPFPEWLEPWFPIMTPVAAWSKHCQPQESTWKYLAQWWQIAGSLLQRNVAYDFVKKLADGRYNLKNWICYNNFHLKMFLVSYCYDIE